MDLLIERIGIGNGRAIDIEHDITGLNTALLRRAVFDDAGDLRHQHSYKVAGVQRRL